MARGWFGVGLLIVFLILGFVVSGAVNSAHLPTEDLLEQAAEKTLNGEFAQAVALGMEAKDRWQRQWDATATVADHAPMEDVDALFGEMEIYARAGEEPHFAACCKELAKRLRAVAEAHKFSWQNVL